MRDDLHRTPSLSRFWRKAVRLAQSPIDAEHLPAEMSRAVALQFRETIDQGWERKLAQQLSSAESDFFRRNERLELVRQAELTAATSEQRQLCAIMKGSIAKDPSQHSLLSAAKEQLFSRTMSSMIELACACVRQHHGSFQASLLRQSMQSAAPNCSLNLAIEKPERTRKPSSDEILETTLVGAQ